MCTVSWLHEEGGYQLFCNRDEKLTRRPASEPQIFRREGVHFLAPIDGDSGGTWLATNEFGVTVCLLNGNGPAQSRCESRGLIVLELAAAKAIAEVKNRLRHLDLTRFAAFSLLVLAPGKPAAVIEWNGQELRTLPSGDACMPLISSSYQPVQVANRRREWLARLIQQAGKCDPGVLLMFHRSHAGKRSAYSPCMHRPDAETVSFSWLTVTDSEASFYYSAGAPCSSFSGESFTLALRKEERAQCLLCS